MLLLLNDCLSEKALNHTLNTVCIGRTDELLEDIEEEYHGIF